MGSTNLYLVPTDPEFAPSPDAVRQLDDWLVPWMQEHLVEGPADTRTSSHAMYFGTVPESLLCPDCGSTLDLTGDELDAWAYAFRQALWTSNDARRLVVTMPCCRAARKAGDLPLESRTAWIEARYARFAVYLPGVRDEEFTPEELQELGALLGCELHQFTESGT